MPESTPDHHAVPAPVADTGDASTPGRTRILDAAEWLFAERGLAGPSLREINEAAGQRNASGVQYHFGNRSGLLRAIVERHMSVIDLERHALLDQADAVDDPPSPEQIRSSMALLVVPLADRLRTASGRCYLRIVEHLVDEPRASTPAASVAEFNSSLARASARLAAPVRALPPELRDERQNQTTSFLLRALADRARTLDDHLDLRPTIAHDTFVSNLIDVLVAVLTAPPSPATRAAIGPPEH